MAVVGRVAAEQDGGRAARLCLLEAAPDVRGVAAGGDADDDVLLVDAAFFDRPAAGFGIVGASATSWTAAQALAARYRNFFGVSKIGIVLL